MLLQHLREERIGWDDIVSTAISDTCEKWNKEIGEFWRYSILRSYFPKKADVAALQLHGFSDTSEMAYAGVVYLRGIHRKEITYVSLVVANESSTD